MINLVKIGGVRRNCLLQNDFGSVFRFFWPGPVRLSQSESDQFATETRLSLRRGCANQVAGIPPFYAALIFKFEFVSIILSRNV
jgi:hypothetical protein